MINFLIRAQEDLHGAPDTLFIDFIHFTDKERVCPGLKGFIVEASDLALFLGYAQSGAIKKQIIGDWKSNFAINTDFFFQDDVAFLANWEQRRSNVGGRLHPEPAKRVFYMGRQGRLFLTETGFEKVLRRTAKPRVQFLRLKMATVSSAFQGEELPSTLIEALSPGSSAPPQKVAKTSSLEERRFQFDVMARLLELLHQFHQHQPRGYVFLKDQAIQAAETALGYRLTEIRDTVLFQTTSADKAAPSLRPQLPNLSQPPEIPGL